MFFIGGKYTIASCVGVISRPVHDLTMTLLQELLRLCWVAVIISSERVELKLHSLLTHTIDSSRRSVLSNFHYFPSIFYILHVTGEMQCYTNTGHCSICTQYAYLSRYILFTLLGFIRMFQGRLTACSALSC